MRATRIGRDSSAFERTGAVDNYPLESKLQRLADLSMCVWCGKAMGTIDFLKPPLKYVAVANCSVHWFAEPLHRQSDVSPMSREICGEANSMLASCQSILYRGQSLIRGDVNTSPIYPPHAWATHTHHTHPSQGTSPSALPPICSTPQPSSSTPPCSPAPQYS